MQWAQKFNHPYVGVEHIFLGLIKEGSGVGVNVLKNLDVNLAEVQLEIEGLVIHGPNMVTMGTLPRTENAKKAIEYAVEEARNLGHNFVGTEHLVLGLFRADGIASQIMKHLGLKEDEIRAEVIKLLGGVDPADAETKDITLAQAKPPTSGMQPAFAITSAPALHLEVTREEGGEIVCVLSDHKTAEGAERELRSFKGGDAVKLLDHVAFTVHPKMDNALIALIALCESGDRFDPGSFHRMMSDLIKFVFELGMKHGQQNKGE
ncbi:MAG: Clp protease N-terminal domain-containing protein [Patescibacteria group bacterium]